MEINLPPVEEMRELLNEIKKREGTAAPWLDPADPKYARAGREFIEKYNEGLDPPPGYRKAKVQPIRPGIKHNGIDPNFHFTAKSWAEIVATDYPDIKWIVPGIIPEGLTVLSGPPKIGKSWLAINLCIAVASGGVALGKIGVAPGIVLCLALEDSEKRVKQRTQAILSKLAQLPDIGNRLHFVTVCAKLDNGLLDALQNFLKSTQGVSMIVIDTLAKVRPSKRPNGKTTYETDYSELSLLQSICNEHGIGIVAITHNRKMSSEDVLEDISGSMGISGSADTLLIMKRARGSNEATLFVTGRDIEQEDTYAMEFDPNIMTWCITGKGPEAALSEEKRDILDIIREHGGKKPIELTRLLLGNDDLKSTGKENGRMRKHLHELINMGLLMKEGDFYFIHPKSMTYR